MNGESPSLHGTIAQAQEAGRNSEPQERFMLRKNVIMAVAGIVILGIAGSVYAIGGAEKGCAYKKEQKARAHVDKVLNRLDASPEQRDHISAEVDNVIAAIWELRADHREIRETIVNEWNQEVPDREVLHALVDQKIEQARAAAHEWVDSGLSVHQVLTPEQRQKVSKRLMRGKK